MTDEDTDWRPPENQRVFVLGDSRTGTSALHNFLQRAGFRSLHYYMDRANITSPIHENMDANRASFFEFIETTDFNAFSDYPTRAFAIDLIDRCPDAYFILSVRETTDRWLKSMITFFSKFDMASGFEPDEMVKAYEGVNDQIRRHARDLGVKFLEVNIDAGDEINSVKLQNFLGLPSYKRIAKDNASDEVDVRILSKRHRLYSASTQGHIHTDIEKSSNAKVMASEYGWFFLMNDTNDFLSYLYGTEVWSADRAQETATLIEERRKRVAALGATYKKFIIPEKSVVYSDYLPRILEEQAIYENRPARMMAEAHPETVYYLGDYLRDARSYGQIYFRGDSHTNWMGGWFVYYFVMHEIVRMGFPVGALINLGQLNSTVASYFGDLITQADDETMREFMSRWDFTKNDEGLEVAINFTLPDELRMAKLVDVPEDYKRVFDTRETFVYEGTDKRKPRAVIFRDSTFDFCHELIAQHFSRAVFIWHQGQVYEDVIEREKPDIVIHAMAERFTSAYPVFGATGRAFD